MVKITDKAFNYVPSFNTDLAKRFKEIIAEQLRTANAPIATGRLSAPRQVARLIGV